MKAWLPFIGVLCALGFVLWIRARARGQVTQWMAVRAGSSLRAGQAKGLLWQGSLCVLAVILLVAEGLAMEAGGKTSLLKYPLAVVLVCGYAPVATIGAPKLTKWQKNFGRRLVEQGADPDAALGLARVSQFFSGLGLIITVVALAFACYHA